MAILPPARVRSPATPYQWIYCMRRRFQLLSLATLLLCASALDVRAADIKARLWVKDLQRSEELLAAALLTADLGEIRRQGFAASKLVGKASDDLASIDLSDRMVCSDAASSLMMISDILRKTPAQAAVSAQRDAKIYRSSMAKCEKAVGVKGKRQLPL